MIELTIDTKGLEGIIDELGAMPQQVQAAMRSTLIKMAGWVRTRSTRGLSKELALQQKIIRQRLKVARLRRTSRGAEVPIWYGLNPVGLIRLQARQNRQGVRAYGGRQVQSGFIRRGKGGKLHVFKREGKARLPIKSQKVEIADPGSDYLRDDLIESAEFRARFLQVFEHELTWRMRRQ